MERLWVKALVYPAVGVLAFVGFVWATLPTDMLADIAEKRLEGALDNDYDVEFEEFGLSGLTGVEADGLTMTSRPPPKDMPEEERKLVKRTVMTVDHVEGGLAILKSLIGGPTVEFTVELGGGEISGELSEDTYEPPPEKPAAAAARKRARARREAREKRLHKDSDPKADPKDPDAPLEDEPAEPVGRRIEATFTDVPLQSITLLAAKLGLPVHGTLSGEINLFLGRKWEFLDGFAKLTLERASVGPGVVADFDVAKVARFGTVTLEAKVVDGKLEFTSLKTTGPDIVIEANGNLVPESLFLTSQLKLNVRVKPSSDFIKKGFGLDSIDGLSPKIRRAKSGEWYGMLIRGPLRKLEPFPSSRTASGLGGEGSKGRRRRK